jgi:hypothetical protein
MMKDINAAYEHINAHFRSSGAYIRGPSEQQSSSIVRRLITLIFAGRSRIIVIRRELPRTSDASPAGAWRIE